MIENENNLLRMQHEKETDTEKESTNVMILLSEVINKSGSHSYIGDNIGSRD